MLKTYDNKLVRVSFLNRDIAEGRTEQGFYASTRNKPDYEYTGNAEGGGTRSALSDKSATVKIKCMRTSDTHKLLVQLAALPSESNVGPLEARDINGGLVERAARAWISKPADTEYSATVGEAEWELTTDELVRGVEAAA